MHCYTQSICWALSSVQSGAVFRHILSKNIVHASRCSTAKIQRCRYTNWRWWIFDDFLDIGSSRSDLPMKIMQQRSVLFMIGVLCITVNFSHGEGEWQLRPSAKTESFPSAQPSAIQHISANTDAPIKQLVAHFPWNMAWLTYGLLLILLLLLSSTLIISVVIVMVLTLVFLCCCFMFWRCQV